MTTKNSPEALKRTQIEKKGLKENKKGTIIAMNVMVLFIRLLIKEAENANQKAVQDSYNK